MSQTINELQERLSPQNLAQQARESVREATVGRVQQMVGSAGDTATQVARRAQEAAAPVVEQVRERPVPIALAGAGVGLVWWLMRRASSRQTWSREDMYNWDDDTMGTREYSQARDYASLDITTTIAAVGAGRAMAAGCACCATTRCRPRSRRRASATCCGAVDRRSMADDYVDTRSRPTRGYDDEDIYGASTTERVSDAARDMGRQAREKASALGEQAREKASALGEKASEKASA